MFRAAARTEWSQLRDYVSGAFFDVLPASMLSAEVGRLSKNLLRRSAFEAARNDLDVVWSESSPSIRVVADLPGPSLADGPDDDAAHAVLVAFFRIVLGDEPRLMDLRPGRLAWHDERLWWAPGRLWTTWDAAFAAGVRDLYRGFYHGPDALFDDALARLELEPARDVMLEHFGGDEQRAVSFDLGTFHATFHEVFVRCRDAGHSLDRGFVGLGLLLACLYETMEALGGTHDVRRAFDEAATA